MRHTRKLWTALGSLAISSLSCTNIVAVSNIQPEPISPGAHGFAPAFLAVCQQLGWTSTCNDPVYTDDQRLRLGPTSYGAHAYVAPSPSLATWTRMSDFATPRWVAVLWTKPETGEGPAATGWMRAGLTCVYLQSVVTGYVAFAQPSTGGCTEPYTPNPAYALSVQPLPNPDGFGEGAEPDQARWVPAVTRFHEGRSQAGTDLPIIGVKCAGRWCLLFPPNSPGTEIPPAHAGMNPNIHTWGIRGWSDAQRLAVGTSPNLNPSHLNASIVADADLATKEWTPSIPDPESFRPGPGQHAATIVLSSRPIGAYDGRWRLKRGKNELYLWKDSSGRWHGEIQNSGFLTTNRIPVYVEKRHAGTNPPATARFRWNADDEEIWVACDGGCCYVSAFQ